MIKPISSEFSATFEAYKGYTDEASRGTHLLVRPSITYILDPTFSVTGGYA